MSVVAEPSPVTCQTTPRYVDAVSSNFLTLFSLAATMPDTNCDLQVNTKFLSKAKKTLKLLRKVYGKDGKVACSSDTK